MADSMIEESGLGDSIANNRFVYGVYHYEIITTNLCIGYAGFVSLCVEE